MSSATPSEVSEHQHTHFRKAQVIWVFGFFMILLVHIYWEFLNEMPPAWDMAHHQKMGFSYLSAWQEGLLFQRFTEITNYYPPFYYLKEALLLGILGPTQFLPLLTNLPGLFFLSYFTFRLAVPLVSPVPAALGGLLPLLFPLVAWTSRESLLDTSLSGWVMLGLYAVHKSHTFLDKRWAVLFGLISAAGIMTKWTFVLFLAPVVAYSAVRTARPRETLINLLDSVLVSVPVVFWWYLPNIGSLLERYRLTTAGAVWEKDPGLFDWLGWIYYVRSISSYYLFLPLSFLLVVGLVRLKNRRFPELLKLVVVAVCGGLLLLTILGAKDPRYVMPLAGPVALILVASWGDRPKWITLMVGLAFLQFVTISFPVPLVPEKVALFSVEDDTDYVGMGREWVWYESNYFDVTGPPRKEDWITEKLLGHFNSGDRVGFVPDMPFFNPVTLEVCALRNGSTLHALRIGQSDESLELLKSVSWVIGKTGDQGISFITQTNQKAYEALEDLGWPVAGIWALPDRSQATLWRNPEIN